MKEHINHKCKIEIEITNSLYYDAIISSVDEKSVTFIDKYNKIYTFSKDKIKEISESEG